MQEGRVSIANQPEDFQGNEIGEVGSFFTNFFYIKLWQLKPLKITNDDVEL